MKTTATILLALMLATPAFAAEDSLIWVLHQIKIDRETKIQKEVLDPMLGPGKAFVFADIEFEVERKQKKVQKSGSGIAYTRKEGGPESEALREKTPRKTSGDKATSKHSTQEQTARQLKSEDEHSTSIALEPKNFGLRILHDADIPAASLGAVREVLNRVYAASLKKNKIEFLPVRFAASRDRGL